MTVVQPWSRFLRLLKPGGRLLISDYCRAPEAPSAEFGAYIAQRGYDLHSVAAYGAMLEAAGFEGVAAEDRTWQAGRFLSVHENELHGSWMRCWRLVLAEDRSRRRRS